MQIEYREHELHCEQVPLRDLADEFGTPLYVYSKQTILDNYRSIDGALTGLPHVTSYALKANGNGTILRMLADEGAGADVVSVGELMMALKAGFPPERITFAGVGKREDEIEQALRVGIFSFNVESLQELQAISRLALREGCRARIALRVNPNIDAQSHPYISTGLREHKFGIDGERALEAYAYAAGLPSLDIAGVHCHIGSQIVKAEPFAAAALFLVELTRKLREQGTAVSHIDLGGGFGVRYVNALQHEAIPREATDGTTPLTPPDILAAVRPILQPAGCTIWLEPGRSVVATAGVLLTRVLYTKENGGKKFVIVDAGMNDLLRPSLYDAYHQIVPARIESYESETVDVVGPVCESGDFLARNRVLNKVKPQSVLAVLTAGAYGFVNASHYNGRPRPAEVLVSGDRVRVIRQRESLDQLM
jgi:diaminopimelate decarboxylase